MKKYLILLLLLFIGLYVAPAAVNTIGSLVDLLYLQNAAVMLEQGTWNLGAIPHSIGANDLFGTYCTRAAIQLFGCTGFAIRFPMLLSVFFAALAVFLVANQCTQDSTVATVAAAAFLTSFGIVGIDWSSANAFLPFYLLCTLFMAYREDDFSLQRFVLLLASGVLSGLVFFSYGAVIALLPLAMAVPFLLWEKRLKELLLMPWLVLAVAGLIACGLWKWLIAPGDAVGFAACLADSFTAPWRQTKLAGGDFFRNLGTLILILLPMLAFAGCTVRGYIGRKFLQLRIYRMAIIAAAVFGALYLIFPATGHKWFVAAFKFSMIGCLSILFAGGFVNYLRFNGRHQLLSVILWIFSLLAIAAGAVLAAGQYMIKYSLLPETWDFYGGNFRPAFFLAGFLTVSGLFIIASRRHTPPARMGIFLIVFTVLVNAVIFLRPPVFAQVNADAHDTDSRTMERLKTQEHIFTTLRPYGYLISEATFWTTRSPAEFYPLWRRLDPARVFKVLPGGSKPEFFGYFPVSGRARKLYGRPLNKETLLAKGLPAVVVAAPGVEIAPDVRYLATSIIRHRACTIYVIR